MNKKDTIDELRRIYDSMQETFRYQRPSELDKLIELIIKLEKENE